MGTRTRADALASQGRKRDRALKRLEVAGTLDYAFRGVGGREAAVAMARLGSHRDDQLRRLVDAYDEMSPAQRLEVGLLETLALAVGLHPAEFFGRVSSVAYRHNFDVAQLTAAMKAKDMIEAAASFGLEKEGFKDRELVLKASKVLESGPLVTVSQQTINAQMAAGLPPVEGSTGRISEMIRALPEAGEDYTDAEFSVAENKDDQEKEEEIDS